MAEQNEHKPLNLGNQGNDEIITMVDHAFKVSFDEGLMEDPVAKSPFYYNGVPIVSQQGDCDRGEILSSVLNIFRDAAEVKFSFINDDLAERLNYVLFGLFNERFASLPGKFSSLYLENVAILPKKHDGGDFNKFIEDAKVLFLLDIRGY